MASNFAFAKSAGGF